MASIMRRLFHHHYPNSDGYTTTIVGLDSAGKTTLLYLLKLGEIVTTIPGIGFNVETVDLITASGKPFKMTAWDIGTGYGLSPMSGIIRTYLSYSDALIWMVDACDKDRLPESIDGLNSILLASEIVNGQMKKDFSMKTTPILILANKYDLQEAMPIDEIRSGFANVLSGRPACVFKTLLNNKGLNSTGLPEAFNWLNFAIEASKSGRGTNAPKALEPPPPNPRAQNTLAEKLESWLIRIETDFSSEDFLAKFRSFTLPSWDHYTHIRIAYIMLTKYGRKDGKDYLFSGLETYIAVSPLTKEKSFHVTMTYFWIQIVHFGIRNMPPLPEREIRVDTEVEAKPSQGFGDFSRFLLINPHVVDGNLWSDYYTRETLMSPKAKSEMVLPDKKPLPNLVSRDAITTFGQKGYHIK